MDNMIRTIIRTYGLEPAKILPAQKGYRNASYAFQLKSGSMLNFILYKDEPAMPNLIRRTNAVGNFVAQCGLPARCTYDSRIVRLCAAQTTRYGALYIYLPGQTIPWDAYAHRHLKLLGKTMSDMHAAFTNFSYTKLPSVTDEYLVIVSRMQRYFIDVHVQHALTQKLQLCIVGTVLQEFTILLPICAQLPHQQPLHMDFVRGNILFQNRGDELVISGILDFEKTAHGHPLFDIARTLAFLLVDCKYKTETQVRKSFLHSGYARRGKASLRLFTLEVHGKKIDVLESLVDLFLLYDFYKFLRHNPYESLPQNQHFIRTRDMMLRRGLLTVATH